jgi:hypothetical protein
MYKQNNQNVQHFSPWYEKIIPTEIKGKIV